MNKFNFKINFQLRKRFYNSWMGVYGLLKLKLSIANVQEVVFHKYIYFLKLMETIILKNTVFLSEAYLIFNQLLINI